MTKRIFVSYARKNRPVVEHLAGDLHRAGFECFFDEDLVGGQDWWDALMDQIERCDVFLPALSAAYLRSVPCAHEATYASALGKPFLPVTLEPDVPASMCPARVAEAQWVAYDATGRDVLLELMAALNAMAPGPPLPAVLPPRPEVPISYLTDLKAKIDQSEPLSWDDQNLLLAELRGRLGGDESADVLLLLRQFGQRHDLYEQVAADLRSVLASHGAATATSPPPSPPPPGPPPPRFGGGSGAAPPPMPVPSPTPAQPAGRSSRWWIPAGALILLALIGVGVALASRSSDSGSTPPTNTTPDSSDAFAVGLSWFFSADTATTPQDVPSELVACTQGKLADPDVAAISAVKVNRDDDQLPDPIIIRVLRDAAQCDYDTVKSILASTFALDSTGLVDSDQESCVTTSVLGQVSALNDDTAPGQGGEFLQPVVLQSLQACAPIADVLPIYLSQLGVADEYIDCASTQGAGMVTWANLLTHTADAELETIAEWCATQG